MSVASLPPGGGEEQHRRVLLQRPCPAARALSRGRRDGEEDFPFSLEGNPRPERSPVRRTQRTAQRRYFRGPR